MSRKENVERVNEPRQTQTDPTGGRVFLVDNDEDGRWRVWNRWRRSRRCQGR